MAINVVDQGVGNSIEIDPEVEKSSTARIVFKGDGNTLKIERGCVLTSASIVVGSRCEVHLGMDSKLASIDIYCANDCKIKVGMRVSCTWKSRLYAHEPSQIVIGDRCLIANEVSIMTSDMHSILDVATGQRINPAEDVKIGEHVWLASSVKVMKGSVIGDDTVIGAASVVTKSIPSNCVAVGVPAAVVRTGVNWNIALI